MDATREVAALLVDDSRLDYLNTRGLLLGSNANVVRAEWLDHWPGATTALAKGPFDLFLVDLHLGNESGLDVIRELRESGVREPIIALTGRADETIDRACAAAGASDFLVKGRFDRPDLERSIRYARHQAEVHRELDRLNATLERRVVAEGDQARLMRFAIDQSTDAIFLTQAGGPFADHAIVYVNTALCRLLDRRAGDLLGSDAVALFVPEDVASDSAVDRAIAAFGIYTGVLRMRRDGPGADPQRDGSAMPAVVRASPLCSIDDRVTHYVWTCRGVDDATSVPSPRRERFETIGRAVGGVAHEFTARLTTVIGSLELLASRDANAADQRTIATALRAAEDLVAETRLLASLANASEDDDLVNEPVDLDALLEKLWPLLRHAAGPLVRLERRTADRPTWTVLAHRMRLKLALVAFASLVPDGSTVTVAVDHLTAATLPDGGTVPQTIDDRRDQVALTMTFGAGHDAAGTPAGDELQHLDTLAREAGGVMTLDREGHAIRTITIFLARAG